MADLRAVGFLLSQSDRDSAMAKHCFGHPGKGAKRHWRRDDVGNDRLARMFRVGGIKRRITGRMNIAAENHDIQCVFGTARVLKVK